MAKTTMLIYHEWAELFEEMPGEDVKNLILALLQFDISGEEPDIFFENKMISAIYKMMFEKTKNNRAVYFEQCAKNRANGAKGGAPKGNQNAAKQPKTTQNNPKQPDRKGCDGIGCDGIGGECVCDIQATHTPALEDVKRFCESEGLKKIDPERFYNYYSSLNWQINGAPFDWQARARLWDSQDKDKKPAGGFDDFPQRDYDFVELEKKLLKNSKRAKP